MRMLRTRILLCLVGMTVVGCSKTNPGLIAVTNPTHRLEFQGFSILPPRGENWFIASSLPTERNVSSIVFARNPRTRPPQTPEELETIVATVTTFSVKDRRFVIDMRLDSPSEFKESVERALEEEVRTIERHQPVASTVALDSSLGSNCVKYDVTVEDRGVPQFPGSVFMMTMHGLRCLHPHGPGTGIDVQYSHRTLRGKQPISVESEVEPFLKSLVFAPTRPLVMAPISIGSGPQVIAVRGGAVWVSRINDNTVSRIDPQTNQVVAIIPVGKDPVGVATSEEAVWVANRGDASVTRIDPRTNQVVSTISVGNEPLIISAGEGAVWVTNSGSNTVSRIDPQTNRVAATIPVGRNPSGVATGEGAIWVTNFGDATVSRIDSQTNKVIGVSIPVDRHPGFAAVGAGAVWVASQAVGTVSRIDPKNDTVVAKIRVGTGASGLAVDGGVVWVSSSKDNTLLKIDPQTNQVIGKPIEVGRGPLGIAIGENAVWVVTRLDDTVLRIDL